MRKKLKMDEDLEKRIQLEELVTVREKFIAENNEAAFHGCPPVHLEGTEIRPGQRTAL